MRRVKYMLNMNFDLSDLEEKSQRLIEVMEAKIQEIDRLAPEFNVRDYLKRLSDEFTEMPFEPLDEIWEDELRRLMNKFDSEES
jgi:hypothetical protein